MEIRVASETLAKELALFEAVVDRKATIPVLQNVKVTANGGVSMAATSIDVSLEGPCSGAVEKAGVITVPAGRLLEMAKALSGAEMRIRMDDKGAVRVTAGQYQSRLQALPPDDFPALKAPDGGYAPVTIDRSALRRMIKQVRFAFATGDARYFLDGAELSFEGRRVRLVSTDSHRLAIASYDADVPYPEAPPIVVPSKAALALAEALGEDGDTPVEYGQQDGTLFFRVDGRLLSSRTVDGKFPAWQRIVPKGYTLKATVDRAALRRAVQRVGLVATGVRMMMFEFAEGAVTVSALSAEIGDAAERIAATYAGPALSVSAQGDYVLDFLANAVGGAVTIEIKDAQSVMIFSDGGDYTCLIMPASR